MWAPSLSADAACVAGNQEGNFTTHAELGRLAAIVAGLPTTLDQDVALLGGAVLPGTLPQPA